MRKVIYMGVSLDGFTADRDGQVDWGHEELDSRHRECVLT
jgi:hypothetical protein